jgi:ketosteroid isomerase-like protein
MDPEQNKALVRAYFRAISESRAADAWAMLADDAIWTVGGHSPLAGTYTKPQLGALTERVILARLVNGLKITLGRVIAEADTVAAEFTSTGERPDGVIYNNHYCFLLTIKEGKLWRCTEYLDTYHYTQVILG